MDVPQSLRARPQGHVANYNLGDLLARFYRAGAGRPPPQGWDGFGLPAENAANQVGEHPPLPGAPSTCCGAPSKRLGYSYDWGRAGHLRARILTLDAVVLSQVLRKGLAYGRRPSQLVPLLPHRPRQRAGDEGRCGSCDSPVEKKLIEQWLMRITTTPSAC